MLMRVFPIAKVLDTVAINSLRVNFKLIERNRLCYTCGLNKLPDNGVFLLE